MGHDHNTSTPVGLQGHVSSAKAGGQALRHERLPGRCRSRTRRLAPERESLARGVVARWAKGSERCAARWSTAAGRQCGIGQVEKTLRRGALDPNLFRAMNALTKVNQSGISPTFALPYVISYGSWDGAKC